jgi:hypothetical protein
MRLRRPITRSEKLTALVILLLSTLFLLMLPNLLPLLIGCPPPGNPSLTISQNIGPPTFDFVPKRRPDAHDPFGYELWQIWKLDKVGNKVKCLWEIAPPKGGPYFLDSLVYGRTPLSWKEVKTAEPLESGNTFYLTAGGFLFIKDKSGVYHVLSGNHYTSAEIEKRLITSQN